MNIIAIKVNDEVIYNDTLEKVIVTEENLIKVTTDVSFNKATISRLAQRNLKTVQIVTKGCILHPHGCIFTIDDDNSEKIRIQDRKFDILPDTWFNELSDEQKAELTDNTIIDSEGNVHLSIDTVFGKETMPGGVTLNSFYKLGYYTDNTRSGKFTDNEYEKYEKYVEKFK